MGHGTTHAHYPNGARFETHPVLRADSIARSRSAARYRASGGISVVSRRDDPQGRGGPAIARANGFPPVVDFPIAIAPETRNTESTLENRSVRMPTYRMVYGDAENVVTETFEDVEVQREDGWVVLFRGPDAILRVQEEHVKSLDLIDNS
jgi:hypothetical protein